MHRVTRMLAQTPPRSRPRREILSARLTLATPALLPELRLYRAGPASGLARLASSGGAPYWAYPWAGGLALARYLLDHPDSSRTNASSISARAAGWSRSRR